MLSSITHNNTPRWQPGERLDHLFEARCDELHAETGADTTAVITDAGSFSFRELDNRANQVARLLCRKGVRSGDRVGMMFDKSAETYIALLAVLKINAAYVPLDGAFPNDRIAFILEDAGVEVLVAQYVFREKLANCGVRQIFVDGEKETIDALPSHRLSAEEKDAPKDELSYIIYTSGTTGNPKGVAIDHASICNFVRVAAEVYGITSDDRVYQGMTIAFDFSVEELWVPLLAGAALVPGQAGASLVGDDLADFLSSRKISVLCCVPTLLATIEQDLSDLRVLLLSGEACPQNLVTRWHKPGRTILNAYGPTEATVTATLTELYPEKPVTIGVPLPTYTIVILNEAEASIVDEGAMGEIGIAGIGLAEGYLNRPDLTVEKFIPDFLNLPDNPSARIYRTGDLGCINVDGEIEFHGRIDTQVKVRGYRIELTEIESVLMQVPGVTQAVVEAYTFDDGAKELVAYFSTPKGKGTVCQTAMRQTLLDQLPPYMVPGYFEELDVIPMTPSNKADRKALPAPGGQRVAAAATNRVAPGTKEEKLLCDLLIGTMKVDQVSIDDHFFQDLGAHSMLMAQFSSKVRKTDGLSSVSMMDIYLNPTVRQLAAHIKGLSAEENLDLIPEAVPLHVPTRRAYYACGAAQAIFLTGYGLFAFWIAMLGIKWSYEVMADPLAAYLRIATVAVGASLLFTAIPIAAKWLLIGCWAEDTFPVWSAKYFRFWLVRTLTESAPPVAFRGGPLFNAYLRLLGARIGRNTVLNARQLPVATDLFRVGENTLLQKDAVVAGYSVRSNMLTIGSVEIGSDVYVGHGSVIDAGTVMEDGSQLAHASSLQKGQRANADTNYHGSPAVVTSTSFRTVDAAACTALRRGVYTSMQIIWSLMIVAPVGLLIVFALFPIVQAMISGQADGAAGSDISLVMFAGKMALVSAAVLAAGLIFGAVRVSVLPRLLNRFLKRDETYVLFGVHYFLHQTISVASNSRFLNILFGDSSAIVHYLKWIGWNLNTIEQTGSNFGTNQKHDNPFLCDIGSSTMVSDGLSMINTEMSASSFRLRKTSIGDSNYLGNNIQFPSNATIGQNCLLGTKVMIPVDGPVRENVGLLGSPVFEIPRTVERDMEIKSGMDDDTRAQRLREKNRHNAITSLAFLAMVWVLTFVTLLVGYGAFLAYPTFGLAPLMLAGACLSLFSIAALAFAERAAFGFQKLRPRTVSIHEPYFWSHERYWKFGETPLMGLFKGTPMKNVVSRMLGVKMGVIVFDDGCQFIDKGLIEIGDYANLNNGATIQGHSLEEGAFKSDHIKIGLGCTLGTAAFVHYGVTIEDNVTVMPDSFVMKGETLEAGSVWLGNPAKAVRQATKVSAEGARKEEEKAKSKARLTVMSNEYITISRIRPAATENQIGADRPQSDVCDKAA